MHENNKIRNPHAVTRRAEIVLRFDMPEEDATQDYMDAIVGSIKRAFSPELGKDGEVEGRWL